MNIRDIMTIPKGELHVHLNGIASTWLLKSLIKKNISELPLHFNLDKDLTIEAPAISLEKYLRPWEALRLIPNNREDLDKIVKSAFINLKRHNVEFVELRNSIIYIAKLNKISIEEAMLWLTTCIEENSRLFNIKAGLIITVSRSHHAGDDINQLIRAYRNNQRPSTVVGLDLAGNENISVSENTAKAFYRAKQDYGLGITIHAGETGSHENIVEAVIKFGADRIGHGTAITKSQRTIDLIVDKNVCLEVCPISNRLTGAVDPDSEHPLVNMIEHKIPFVICSDNPSIHNSSISHDYYELLKETGRADIFEHIHKNQKKYSFLEV